MDELISLSAVDAVAALRAGAVSPTELVEASLARIADVGPAVNALPTTCGDRARAHARRLEDAVRAGGDPGPLAGLPLAIKDLTDVAGVRTTQGSTLFADRVPETSDLVVQRLESRGGIVVAKSNTPEFGNGANTVNDVFGATRNPWDTARSPGGSSGGAAVALRTGQVWLAHGTDVGGSLRTPAAMCGVVGLRPTPGRVAHGPTSDPFDEAGVDGPMARSVGDLALLLDAMAGTHPRDPVSLAAPDRSYVDVVAHADPPGRVAFSPDLGGFTTVDPEVAAICRAAVTRLEDLGTSVGEATVDVTDLSEAYHLLRGRKQADLGHVLGDRLDETNDDVQWNVRFGQRLTGAEAARGRALRGQVHRRWMDFLGDWDLLALPAAIVTAPPVEVTALDDYRGMDFQTYIDWVKITFLATTVASPALVVPVGFTRAGLPVGVQLVGPPRREDVVLAAGAVVESMLGLDMGPIDPRPAQVGD